MSTTQELPAAWIPFAKELVTVDQTAPVVSPDQIALVKQTVANGATDAELKLFLFDCARQGVHPLDRLIHFTKRGGKYTPITSIDFMRTRAADTGEYAGSDDAVFSVCEHCGGANLPGPDVVTFAARVTVWRLVQGQRCSFTATARWSEYCPSAGQDHMWKKMPHTMLAKCAEALALRKGFPRQLAGLYAKEEMDQAGPSGGYSVEAPKGVMPSVEHMQLPSAMGRDRETAMPDARQSAEAGVTHPAANTSQTPTGPRSVTTCDYATTQNNQPHPDDGLLRLVKIDSSPTQNKNVTKYFITLSTGEQLTTIKTQLASLCEQLVQDQDPVTIETKKTKWGTDLVSVHRVRPEPDEDPAALALAGLDEHGFPIDPPF